MCLIENLFRGRCLVNGGLSGSSGDHGSGGDGIPLSLTPFQDRLSSTMLSSLKPQHGVVCLTRLERVGLSFEMGQVPSGKISYRN